MSRAALRSRRCLRASLRSNLVVVAHHNSLVEGLAVGVDFVLAAKGEDLVPHNHKAASNHDAMRELGLARVVAKPLGELVGVESEVVDALRKVDQAGPSPAQRPSPVPSSTQPTRPESSRHPGVELARSLPSSELRLSVAASRATSLEAGSWSPPVRRP